MKNVKSTKIGIKEVYYTSFEAFFPNFHKDLLKIVYAAAAVEQLVCSTKGL